MELNFRLWVEGELLVEHGRTGSGKLSLYPPLYTQYLNYPPQDVINWSADAITYMDPADVKEGGRAVTPVDSKTFKPYYWHDQVNKQLVRG